MLSVSTESVNLYLEMGRNTPCYLIASALLCGSASEWALKKHGADNAAADKSQGSHIVHNKLLIFQEQCTFHTAYCVLYTVHCTLPTARSTLHNRMPAL